MAPSSTADPHRLIEPLHPSRARPAAAWRGVAALAAILAAAAGVWRAIALAWVCDDSFISFRYAENLIHGRGLVYNAGERVEGYSNLLWTLLVAAWMRAGVDPVRAAQGMGIASYLLLLCLLAGWSMRRWRHSGIAAVPVAAVVAIAANDFHVWATGGLETMFFALLGVAAILLARLPARPGRAWGVGGLLALLALTRPDGLLYAPPALLSLWLTAPRDGTGDGGGSVLWQLTRGRVLELSRALTPLIATLAALIVWKLAYYGELLPTAFYSKSAALPYWDQGLRYLGLYLAKSWYLLPALVIVPLWARRRARPAPDPTATAATATATASSTATKTTDTGQSSLAFERDDRVVFLGAAILLAAYVLHSGGDFMFARRFIPVAPFVLLALESWIASIDRTSLRFGLAAGLIAGALAPYPVFGEGKWRISGIADEPHFYPPEAVATRRAQGELMGELLGATPVRAMFEGGMCMFAYYSKLPYLVEMTGLTQYSLARLPLAERGVIGHEKQPDEQWLEDNEIHLLVAQEWPISQPPPGARRHDDLYLGNLVRARVLLYSDAVMDPLRERPLASFIPIEQVVARLRGEMEAVSPAHAEAILQYLDRYYLRTAGTRGLAVATDLQTVLDRKRRAEETASDMP